MKYKFEFVCTALSWMFFCLHHFTSFILFTQLYFICLLCLFLNINTNNIPLTKQIQTLIQQNGGPKISTKLHVPLQVLLYADTDNVLVWVLLINHKMAEDFENFIRIPTTYSHAATELKSGWALPFRPLQFYFPSIFVGVKSLAIFSHVLVSEINFRNLREWNWCHTQHIVQT